jgi:hypothetical protein
MTVVTGAVVEEYAPSHHRCIRCADDFTLGDRLWGQQLAELPAVNHV